MNNILCYTDGACRGNGSKNNIGAYAAVLKYGNNKKELAGFQRNTTNNEMELKGAILALSSLTAYNIPVYLYTDSAYVCNCINNEWYKKWMENGWVTSSKKPVANRKLWIELIKLVEKFQAITFIKVKGHSDNEGNNRADELCNKKMDECGK